MVQWTRDEFMAKSVPEFTCTCNACLERFSYSNINGQVQCKCGSQDCTVPFEWETVINGSTRFPFARPIHNRATSAERKAQVIAQLALPVTMKSLEVSAAAISMSEFFERSFWIENIAPWYLANADAMWELQKAVLAQYGLQENENLPRKDGLTDTAYTEAIIELAYFVTISNCVELIEVARKLAYHDWEGHISSPTVGQWLKSYVRYVTPRGCEPDPEIVLGYPAKRQITAGSVIETYKSLQGISSRIEVLDDGKTVMAWPKRGGKLLGDGQDWRGMSDRFSGGLAYGITEAVRAKRHPLAAPGQR